MAIKRCLLCIDMQRDFLDESPNGNYPAGSLAVPGAWMDGVRLAALVDRAGGKIDEIVATLDSHRTIDIAHPAHWIGDRGQHPDPFTIIANADIKAGRWRPRVPGWTQDRLAYTEALEAAGKYQLMIWPPHCLIGSAGATVHPVLFKAFTDWEAKYFAAVSYEVKGDNISTEHYSAVQAEVADPADPRTMLNAGLIARLEDYDEIAIAGEALSHCVRATVEDIVNNIDPTRIKHLVFLEDCSSPVAQAPGGPDFPAIGRKFVKDMQSRGMQVTTSTAWLA